MATSGEPMEVDVNSSEDDEEVKKENRGNTIEDPEGRLVSIKEDDQSVDLTHCRLKGIPVVITNLKKIEILCLRQNNVDNMAPISGLTTLTDLDLYDNDLAEIQGLEGLVELRSLDLSFNHIRVMECLSSLVNLRDLYLINNKLTKIDNIATLTNLTMLELGSNRIRVIEGLDTLVNLEKLFLGRNKISKLQNLEKLVKLKCLSLQCNRLTCIEGLDTLQDLDELYLSDNGITEIQGLANQEVMGKSQSYMYCTRGDKFELFTQKKGRKIEKCLSQFGIDEKASVGVFTDLTNSSKPSSLVKLSVLDLAVNRIEKLQNLSHLVGLEDLWMNNNKISDWKDIDHLVTITNLQTVYFEHNPIAADPQYRRKLKLTLPSLTQIDATMIR